MDHVIRNHDLRLLPPDPPEDGGARVEVRPVCNATRPAENPPELDEWDKARNVVLYHLATGYRRGDYAASIARVMAVDLDAPVHPRKVEELYELWPDRGLFNYAADIEHFETLVEDLLGAAGFYNHHKETPDA